MPRLLILSCSQRKDPSPGKLPALDRYDGPAFRVLRKYLREADEVAPTVLILSAKYGLIGAEAEIPDYDRRLTAAGARQLHPAVLEAIAKVLMSRHWHSIAVCLGKTYRVALEGFTRYVPVGARVEVLSGGLGPRLTSLRQWLWSTGLPSDAIEPARKDHHHADERPTAEGRRTR